MSKLVSSLTRGGVRSPVAQCLLVRFTARVIAESSARDGERPFYDFLESCLRHKSEMVIFEAARAITEMNEVTTRELTPAITVLQLFLSSSKPVLRFAAVRTLNKVAMTHPVAVTNCNIDMEGLISDPNRAIATLAITTLLKTGNESSVERLMKQIQAFLNEIQDENKIVVVEAVRSLCLKYPAKHRALMAFLANVLREEGGFEYKKAIVDTILVLIREIPEAKEPGLSHLCEFIEDCEFTYLSSQARGPCGAPAAPPPPLAARRQGGRLRAALACFHRRDFVLLSGPSFIGVADCPPPPCSRSGAAPARRRGPRDGGARQVHPLHLQPHHPRERERARERRQRARQVRRALPRAAAARRRAAPPLPARQRR